MQSIENLTWENILSNNNKSYSQLQEVVKHNASIILPEGIDNDEGAEIIHFNDLINCCREIDNTLLASLGGCFPVFLVPANGLNIDSLGETTRVRIYFSINSKTEWSITDTKDNPLFSFDLPEELFNSYLKHKKFNHSRILGMKEKIMDTIQATWINDHNIKFLSFKLDQKWIDDVKDFIEKARK